ncbi:hypothetical protein GCM10027047_15910 [Rhodococcus aerolatus]
MDLHEVFDELAALDPAALTEDDRAALLGCVRRLVGRRALLAPVPPAGPGPGPADPCCEHAAAALPAPEPARPEPAWPAHHPALRRRARPVLRLVPGSA